MGGGRENEENGDADDAKEKDAARSFVSFFSEKETKDPWPPPLLSVVMDPDPEYYLYKQLNINMLLTN